MKVFLLFIIMLSMFLSLAFCQQDELSVEVMPHTTTAYVSGDFMNTIRITNVSDRDQAFCFLGCYSLKTDSSLIFFPYMCLSNMSLPKRLGPGERIEMQLYLRISEKANPKEFTFRVSFQSFCSAVRDISPTIQEGKAFWSNPVTIKIKPKQQILSNN